MLNYAAELGLDDAGWVVKKGLVQTGHILLSTPYTQHATFSAVSPRDMLTKDHGKSKHWARAFPRQRKYRNWAYFAIGSTTGCAAGFREKNSETFTA